MENEPKRYSFSFSIFYLVEFFSILVKHLRLSQKVMVNVTDFNFNDVLPIEKKYWRNFDKLNSVYYWRIGKCLVNAYLKISEGNGKVFHVMTTQANIICSFCVFVLFVYSF